MIDETATEVVSDPAKFQSFLDTQSRMDRYSAANALLVYTKNFAIDRIPDELAKAEPKDIRAELSKTRTAMSEVYGRVSDELYRQKQERSKDMER